MGKIDFYFFQVTRQIWERILSRLYIIWFDKKKFLTTFPFILDVAEKIAQTDKVCQTPTMDKNDDDPLIVCP